MSDTLAHRRTANRGVWFVGLIFLVLLINVPALWSMWSSWQLDAKGEHTRATVVAYKSLPEGSQSPTRFFITYKLPADADPKRTSFDAEVDRETFFRAQTTFHLDATYLKGRPSASRVEGQQGGKMGIYLVGAADVALLLMVLLALRFAPKPEKPLVLLATADVVRAKPGFEVREEGEEYVVRGEVLRIEDGEVVLGVGGDREVRVVLGDCVNPVGHQQTAEVRGRRLDAV